MYCKLAFFLVVVILLFPFLGAVYCQNTPTGNPSDFKVKTCLHSVSYAGVWRGQAVLGVDEFLLKAKNLGFDGVMLVSKRPHVSPHDYDSQARKKLKARIQELGLELVCLAGYTDFTAGVEKPDLPNVEIQAAYVGELAGLAGDLGTNMVRIFTGYEREGIPFDVQYAMVLEGLKMAGKKAAEFGVTLAVQNHHDIAVHQAAMRRLLDEVNLPNVKAAWDAWSPAVMGFSSEEIRQFTLNMKPYLVHTTAANYIRLPRFHYEPDLVNYRRAQDVLWMVPIDEGMIDYRMFINTLREIGYQGYLGFEMCAVLRGGGSVQNLDKYAKEFLQYVKQFQ
ncbi:MAG TPA: sugar phosphate isomerase/epimerase family protein [archaeon]|nr:sugar phosphate isomerase/epimerase family protein [archaeon]